MKKGIKWTLALATMMLLTACGRTQTPLEQARECYLADPALAWQEGCFVEEDGRVTAGGDALEQFAQGKTDGLRMVSLYQQELCSVTDVTREEDGYALRQYGENGLEESEHYPYLRYGVYDKPSGANETTVPFTRYSYCVLCGDPDFDGAQIDRLGRQMYSSYLPTEEESAPQSAAAVLYWEVQRIDPRK